MNTFPLLLVLAYLLGSIPFGKLIGFLYKVDIQKKGSGNIGFANAVRVLGWRAGIIVLIGDVIKGYLPVYLALSQELSTSWVAIIVLVVVLGHIFPVWLRFRGGKGVATGLGATLALSPWLGLVGIAVYLGTLALIRKSGPSSVLAALSLPLGAAVMRTGYVSLYVVLALIAIYTHRQNIRELFTHDR